jgi:hypothetical protein
MDRAGWASGAVRKTLSRAKSRTSQTKGSGSDGCKSPFVMALLCRNKPFGNLSLHRKAFQNGIFTGVHLDLMPTLFGAALVCLLAPKTGATTILRSSAVPEFKLLFLVGGGLVVLAGLVRRLYPLGVAPAPKSIQVLLWISPQEIAEHLSARDRE